MKQQQFNFSVFQVAELELTYESKKHASLLPVVSSSCAAYDLLSTLWRNEHIQQRQQFNVILLNRANRVLGVFELPVADLLKRDNYQRKVYTQCLKANAVAMIIGHYFLPEAEHLTIDEETIAKELKHAGSFLDITVLDCIVSTEKGYSSLADQGLL